jgi:hypothetical protein
MVQGVQPLLITDFNAIVSTFRDWCRQIGKRQCGLYCAVSNVGNRLPCDMELHTGIPLRELKSRSVNLCSSFSKVT